jgi:RNA polymerase sigma factor (sigma-70 family)
MSPSVSVRLLLTQSDARLLQLARTGHERAFEALVARHQRALLGYCRRLLLPDERAEDALQQGLLQAWLALRAGAEVRAVKPWLFRVVHNVALNMRRSGYDYAQLHESLSGASAPAQDLDRRIAVREALAGLAALPEMQREALLRTAVEGNSHEQAAVAMGLSEGAVRGLVYRARATLRAAAGALVPSPLVNWALSSAGGDAPLSSRLAELGAGGSAGLAGVFLKAGATAVTAGVLVGGVGALHHPHDARAQPRTAPAIADGSAARGGSHELALFPQRSSSSAGTVPGTSSGSSHRSPTVRAPRGKVGGKPKGEHAARRPWLAPAFTRTSGRGATSALTVVPPGERSRDQSSRASGQDGGKGEGNPGSSSGDGGSSGAQGSPTGTPDGQPAGGHGQGSTSGSGAGDGGQPGSNGPGDARRGSSANPDGSDHGSPGGAGGGDHEAGGDGSGAQPAPGEGAPTGSSRTASGAGPTGGTG